MHPNKPNKQMIYKVSVMDEPNNTKHMFLMRFLIVGYAQASVRALEGLGMVTEDPKNQKNLTIYDVSVMNRPHSKDQTIYEVSLTKHGRGL